MGARRVIGWTAAALAVAAGVSVWLTRPRALNVRAVDVRTTRSTGAAVDPVPQDFALPEVAVSECDVSAVPGVFVVEVAPPGAAPHTTYVLEASDEGRALVPPVPNGSRLEVAVVAGGLRFGYPDEEQLGTATAVAPAHGGRFAVIVNAHLVARPRPRGRLFVVDSMRWPVAGATVSSPSSAWSATTSASGWCVLPPGTSSFDVAPPTERPDLAPIRRDAVDPERPGYVELRSVAADVTFPLPPLFAPPAGAEVTLRCADGRPFIRRSTVSERRKIGSIPLGRYLADWTEDGVPKSGVLEVGSDGSSLVAADAGECRGVVELPGAWTSFEPAVGVGLALVERSRRSCLLPAPVADSMSFAMVDGRGFTSDFRAASIDDGAAVFDDVPAGDWEVVSIAEPYAVSHCLSVARDAAGVRVECAPSPRASRLAGSVQGADAGTAFVVEIRGHGGMFAPTRSVTCPGTFEFSDLNPGLYSVRAAMDRSAAEAGRLLTTPWRNVAVGPGESVSVEFSAESVR